MKKLISLLFILLIIPFIKINAYDNNKLLLIDYDKCINDNKDIINTNIDLNISNINIRLEINESFNIYVNNNIIYDDYLILFNGDDNINCSYNINLDFITISDYIKKESRLYYEIEDINLKLYSLHIYEYEYTYIIDTNYNDIKNEPFYVEYIYLEDDIYYYENSTFILFNFDDVLTLNEINIGYYMNLCESDFINYIDVLIPYSEIDVKSKYFYSTNVIDSYEYTVYVNTNFGFFENTNIINVIDDRPPIINALTTYYGYKSDLKEIEDIFSDISSYDEIDLDLSNRIEIIDLDDYENNKGNVGEYRFKLTCKDNSLNESIFYTKYIVYDDILDNDIDLVNENIDINDLDYHFKSSTNKLLTRKEIKNILVDLKYYDIESELLIISDYFDNYQNEGSYKLLIDDGNQINSFVIDVTKGKLIESSGENINVSNRNKYIIISIVFIIFVGIILIISIIFIKKRKIEIIK